MQVHEVLTKRRTIRKFKGEKLKNEDLLSLVEYARLCPYPTNTQPLKFSILTDEKLLDEIFPHTKWAGYLKDGAPNKNERPKAYIAVFGDKKIKNSFETEACIALITMIYGAYSKGIASCWLGAINRDKLLELFKMDPSEFELVYLLALGYPAQESQAVTMSDSFKYFEDENGIINVPKKSIDDILIDINE